ncbi:MAG: ligase-associated DNA damage response exonuclease [Pseudomonadota bacterium]
MADLLTLTEQGLYCAAGDFFIDPWPRVGQPPPRRAIVTHGHADHARPGSASYLATPETAAIMRQRISKDLPVDTLGYGTPIAIGDVEVSLHSAGHVLGSAQVRVSNGRETWVVSGDYKRDPDPTCAPFEVVPCTTFITEATFALPIYRWRDGSAVVQDIADWWRGNADRNTTSVLFCYALGKAQRVLGELAALAAAERPLPATEVLLHGAMTPLIRLYEQQGVRLFPSQPLSAIDDPGALPGALVLAPPSAAGSPWMRRFKKHRTGFVSGWMRVRGNRRRRGYDRGFVLSDHADWPGLVDTVTATGAERVLATHGKTDVLVRYLRERNVAAAALSTRFGEEESP